MKFLTYTICLSLGEKSLHKQKRLCYDFLDMLGEEPKKDQKEDPKKKRETTEISDEQKEKREGLKKGQQEERLALLSEFNLVPKAPDSKKKPEGAKKDEKKEDDAKSESTKEAKDKQKEKEDKEKDEKEPFGPKIPERAKDAMNSKELREAFSKCKNDKERHELMMDQLAKGNVPEKYRKFEKVTVEVKGRKLEWFKAPSGFQFGTSDDPVEFPMNGPMAQAITDATGCVLPNKWMVDKNYAHSKANGQMIPFTPFPVNGMRSAETIFAASAKYRELGVNKNVDWDKPIDGYYKNVIQPEPGVTGGPGRLEIYGGIYESGKMVQGLSAGFHDKFHDDYSQNICPTAAMGYLDGKPCKVEDVLSDPELAKHFGFAPIPKNNKYTYEPWVQEKVKEIQEMTPAEFKTEVKEAEHEAEHKDTETSLGDVFSSISDEDLHQGTVLDERDYTLAGGAKGGHVKFVKTDQGDIAELDFQGKTHQVKVDLKNETGISSTEGYEASGKSPIAGPFSYIMLDYFAKHPGKLGEIVPFEYNGKKFLARREIHNDGPNGPIPYDHPGVGIFEQSEAGTKDTPMAKTTATPDLFASTDKQSKSHGTRDGLSTFTTPDSNKPGITKFTGRASGGGGYTSVAYTPAPGPAYTSATYNPEQVTHVPAPETSIAPLSKPVEQREGIEGKINGPTLLLGDSIMYSTRKSPMAVDGMRKTFAKGGETSRWLLRNLQKLRDGKPAEIPADFTLDMFKGGNAVVQIGTNDIGSLNDPRYTKEEILKNIEEIWQILEDMGITVYACTIPPFKGHTFSTYGKRYKQVNDNRNWINDQIIKKCEASGRQVIRVDELVGDQDHRDENGKTDTIGPEYLQKFGKQIDWVHPKPDKLANLIESEVVRLQHEKSGKQPTEAKPTNPPPDTLST